MPDGNLYRAQAALSCLEQLACYYAEKDADMPAENFFSGLSVILGYIKAEVETAYNELTSKEN